jgi:hypothetical protein
MIQVSLAKLMGHAPARNCFEKSLERTAVIRRRLLERLSVLVAWHGLGRFAGKELASPAGAPALLAEAMYQGGRQPSLVDVTSLVRPSKPGPVTTQT